MFFRGHKFTLIRIGVLTLIMTRDWLMVWKALNLSAITQAGRPPLWRCHPLPHGILQPQGRGGPSATQSCAASFNQDSQSIDRCLQQSSKFPIIALMSAVRTWCTAEEASRVCGVRSVLRDKGLSYSGDQVGLRSCLLMVQTQACFHIPVLLGVPHRLCAHNRCQNALMRNRHTIQNA